MTINLKLASSSWDEEEINIVNDLFKYMLKLNNNDKMIYFKIIETLITEKEKKICEFIQKVSSSYD